MRNLATGMRTRLRHSRIMLYGIAMPLALSLMGSLDGVGRIAVVVFGFSLIIFLHELGHFVVARTCSVKCLTFSLGIGPRAFGWKKGFGFNFGREPGVIEISKEESQEIADKQAGVTFKEKTSVADEKDVGYCDYRVSWLPLGGYVRMLGQDDMDPTKVSSDPQAFNQRPIWQRMCIISAGVIMNLIFAAVVFSIIFSPSVGVGFPPAQVGGVVYDSPAWKAGLRRGDTIVSIDGWKPTRGFLEFTDIKLAAALSSGKRKIQFGYLRPGVAQEQTAFIQPTPGPDGLLSIGIDQMPSLMIVPSRSALAENAKARGESIKDGGLGQPEAVKEIEKLQPRDQIVAVDGKPVSDYVEMYNVVQAAGPRPVPITLKNPEKGGGESTITLTAQMLPNPGVEDFPSICGVGPELMVEQVEKKGAAANAKMEAGDIIVAIGERQHPNVSEFRAIAKDSGGQTLRIVVRRGNDILPLDVQVPGTKGTGLVGIYPGYALETMSAVVHDPGAAGLPQQFQSLPEGATLAKVDGQAVSSWDQVVWLVEQKKPEETVALTFALPAKTGSTTAPAPAEVTGNVALSEPLLASLRDETGFRLNLPVEVVTQRQHAQSLYGAMMMGLDHTERFAEQVYMTLDGLLIRHTVPPSSLHGIVGIGYFSYVVQERGMAWFWYLMGIVSVNLAVINFLPLPIVDGGHFLLLILEKLRGKPLSLKVQSAIQVVGLVLLVGLFLFVTWNDLGLFK